MTTTLVTGATGNVGRHVVSELFNRGASLRAFVRDPVKAKLLPADVDLCVGDFDDPASVRAALDGVDQVFLLTPTEPRQVEHQKTIIDAAADAGVSCLVKLSALGSAPDSPLLGLAWNGVIEEHLRRRDLPTVVLQATWFMTNVLLAAEVVKQTDNLFAPAGDGKVAMIDPRDIAAAAAVTLTTPGHLGKTYILTGGEAVTYTDLAASLANASQRPIEYVDVPEGEARHAFVEQGLPDWLVTHLVAAFRLLREGCLAQTSDCVRVLTGQAPRTIDDFARAYGDAFGA